MNPAWSLVDDLGDLAEAHRLVAAALDALTRERAAVRRLDVAALAAITDEKQALLAALEALTTRATTGGTTVRQVDPRREEMRVALRDRATLLTAQAEANAALLGVAIDAVAEALGLREPATTYDARARVRRRTSPLVGKRL